MKAIVVIPTFNEKENIKSLLEEILNSEQNIHALVVDDRSPDGTAEAVKALSQGNPRIHLIIREGPRQGRALADLEGYRFALRNGFDAVIAMDADFSHHPRYLPQFLKAAEQYDIVVGSRLIKGGEIVGRGFLRNAATLLANFYIRLCLGLDVKDWSSGYRCYRRAVLEALPLNSIASKGPSLLEEILFSAKRKGFKICEIPIIFVDRQKGKSKLTFKELGETLWLVFKMRFFRAQ